MSSGAPLLCPQAAPAHLPWGSATQGSGQKKELKQKAPGCARGSPQPGTAPGEASNGHGS